MTQAPPPIINNALVLEYAVVQPDSYSGRERLVVDGEPLGPVSCLAISQSLLDDEILCFRCDRGWRALGITAHPSIAEAKHSAEVAYPGVSRRWIRLGVSRADAEAFRDSEWGDLRCSFCGLTPDHYAQLIASDLGPSVCNRCIAKLRSPGSS